MHVNNLLMNSICDSRVFDESFSVSMSKLEIDKALAEVKLKAERKCLSDEEKRCEELKEKILNLEEEYMARREKVWWSISQILDLLQQTQQILKVTISLKQCPIIVFRVICK